MRLHCCKNKDCWVMASLRAFLPLALCLLIGRQTFAINDAPCQLSKRNNSFSTFLGRHLPYGTPSSLDQNQWEDYIKNTTDCNRPTQSFLPKSDEARVKAVCTNKGGVVYRGNLCISRQPFTYVTVSSKPGTCGIRSVKRETKHLILACEDVSNQCLPVHFEGNPTDATPGYYARGCQDTRTRSDAPSSKMTWVWLLSAVLVILYGYPALI